MTAIWFSFLVLALAVAIPPPLVRVRLGRGARYSPPRPVLVILFSSFSVLVLFLTLGKASVAIALSVCGVCSYLLVRQRVERGRETQRDIHLASFLTHVGGELKAGEDIAQAWRNAVRELSSATPAILREPLEATAVHVSGGGSGAKALAMVAGESTQLTRLATLWELADRHGIAFAPLVLEISKHLDANEQQRAALRASLTGPQASAIILTLLPLCGIALGESIGARPLSFLLSGGLGGLLLMVGVTLSCAGFLWAQRIITGVS